MTRIGAYASTNDLRLVILTVLVALFLTIRAVAYFIKHGHTCDNCRQTIGTNKE